MSKPSFGVMVGRFQVHTLHDGHLDLINTVRSMHNRVILFLGVPSVLCTRRNPLDFETRKRMVLAKFPDVTVLPLPDMGSDEAWSRELDKRIREVAQYGEVTLYGGRDSFVPCYHGDFRPVVFEHLKVPKSGEEVRAEISNTVMESADFRAGVIYATQNRFPAAIPTVDIAIYDQTTNRVLLGKKENEGFLRFPGGHVDPTDTDLEEAARREIYEETTLSVGAVEYVGSHRIDDWRWTKEQDKIITSLFYAPYVSGSPRASDDLAQVEWLHLRPSDINYVAVAHRPLFAMLINFVEKENKCLSTCCPGKQIATS